MMNALDVLIFNYVQNATDAKLSTLHKAFMTESLHVPVSKMPNELDLGRFDIPVIYVRTDSGDGAIPTFTSIEQLLKWKPLGCLYVMLTGHELIAMAFGMKAISEILVNPNSAPRGQIPRVDFKRMLKSD